MSAFQSALARCDVSQLQSRLFLFEEYVNELDVDVVEDQRDDLNVAGAADFVSMWWYRTGLSMVLHGDPAGWAQFHRGLLWNLVSNWITFSYFSRTKFEHRQSATEHSIRSVCLSIAATSSVGMTELCKKMAGQFADFYLVNAKTKSYFEGRDIEPLLLHLCTPRFEEQWGNFDFGEYQLVANALRERRPLSSHEVMQLCNYHVRNIQDNDCYDIPPFRDHPFDVVPVEIHCMRNAFAQKQIPFPSVSHELLDSNVGSPPQIDFSLVEDPLLLKVASNIGFVDLCRLFSDVC